MMTIKSLCYRIFFICIMLKAKYCAAAAIQEGIQWCTVSDLR